MEGAAVLSEEADALRGEPLDRWVLAWLTTFLAMAALYEGDYELSDALGTEALAIYRELGDTRGIVICHVGLGLTELAKGDHEQAALLFEKTLRLLRGPGEKSAVAYALLGLAGADATRGEPARAGRLWGAAEALREEIGATLSHWDLYGYDYEGRVSAARTMLGDEGAWEAVFAQGRAMSAKEATEYALSQEGIPAAPESPPADGRTTDPLTPREREVAGLVARGLANHQIASELYLSERTIETHVSKILRKLGLASRAQIATWATERRLLVKSNTD
jgi:DNA-binding CsgD family transcriptional regulator